MTIQLPFNQLVIASGNQGKLKELAHLLAPLGLNTIAQGELNISEAEEPHATFVENALAKARHASQQSGLPSLADDSGLCVDALQGAPGVHSARYACDTPDAVKSDARNNQKLLQQLANVSERHAHFYCVIVFIRHAQDPQPIIAEGVWRGEILTSARGDGGFGYDPLFLDAMTGKSVAEIPLEVKSRISHRGQAMRKLIDKLERLAHE
jgi:XTP/dITP diphosphohydrolase